MDKNWSIEAIHETAANSWSLEGDNQLLNLMKSISKNLEQRCMTSNNNLNRLLLDVDKTKIKLGNATTRLLDLNNAKFVEHTVMDMDSILSNPEKCSTVENDKLFVSLPKAVEQAVANGLNMMDRCYEKVLLNLEDSDDDDENESGQKHVVCSPKNPYIDRPLPHLIGSKLWNEKWHIGLIESDEEVLSDEDPEEFSQSSSEDEDSISNSPRTSNPPTTSESDFVATSSAHNHREDLFRQLNEDNDDKSPLFTPGDTKHREKIKVLPKISNDVATESTNNEKEFIKPTVPSSEQAKQTIFVQQKPQQKFLNLFDDEPPPSLDEPIRNERKPANLFLDSDDDDDNRVTNTNKSSSIFNNNVATRPSLPFSVAQVDNTSDKKYTSKDFTSHGDFDNNNAPPTAVTKSAIKPTLKSNDFGGLFDDEPPDDFFDIIVREQSGKADDKKIEKPKLQSKTVNLFDSDDDDDDDFSKIIGTTKKSDSKVSAFSHNAKESIPAVMRMEKGDISHSPYNSPSRSNTGPPPSYVSFLDDDTSSFDDDKDEKLENTKQEPIGSDQPMSRQNLFDDTTSDDPIVPIHTENQKSPVKIIYDDIAATIQEKESATKQNVISSESLFDETPPDDQPVKPQPVALPRKSTSTVMYAINADVPSIPISTEEKTSDSRDEIDQSLTFRKNLSLFLNPEAGKIPTIEKDTKPKPNKLKMNFNINVAALLPGAKLPSQKQSANVKEDRIDEPEPAPQNIEHAREDDTISSRNASQISSKSKDETSGRLNCVSKNRVKIQVPRKPSTRTGRQNLYQRTLLAENENVVSSEETTDSLSIEEKTQEQVIDVVAVENDSKKGIEDNDWLTESPIQDQPPEQESSYSNSNVDIVHDKEEEEEDWLKNIEEKPSSTSKTNLYDDDWLSSKELKTESKPPTQSLSHVMNYDWLTASNLPPEDINPPSNYSIDDENEQDDWLTSYVSKDRPSIVADLPNDDEDDDDWLITSVHQGSSRRVIPVVGAKGEEENELRKSANPPEKRNNLQVDEDNDDWLTKSLAPAKVSSTVNQSSTIVNDGTTDAIATDAEASETLKSGLFDSNDESKVKDIVSHSRSKSDQSEESAHIFVSKKGTKNSILSSTLFDDDDGSSSINVAKTSQPDVPKQKMNFDGKSTEIFKPKTETKKLLSSKLFDDDDDDDLFSSISHQKSTPKPATTSQTVKPTKNVSIKETVKSLFSDDDNSDSDDLFGKTTKKQEAKVDTGTKPKVNKSVKKGLFDDDDDDDDEDIFASKAHNKQRGVQTDTKRKPSITKSVATIPASDDPLADLLK